ncbi:MAG: cytochrome c oxidase subunit II [Chloroflexi bacterium]|nr:cytochrome c oxidase subunit II [Chloroflexota bacterium]
MHVDTYERYWIMLTAVVLIVFTAAVGISGFMMGVQVPVPEALVNPNTVATDPTSRFANPGLRQLAPNRYEAYIRAGSSPWKFVPDKLEVPVGSTVTFYVTSVDVQHGFKLEGTNINVQILPGQVSKMTATFKTPGKYPFICTEYCGVGHQNMFGELTVK